MRCCRAVQLMLMIGLLAPAWTWAQDKKKPVDVEVWAIRATTRNKEISKELRGLAEALKKQFKYTGFKLEKRSGKKGLALGKSFKASLIHGYKVAVTPKARVDKRIQLQVVVTKLVGKKTRTVLKSTVTIRAGPFIPYGCGSLSGGDYLIMAVRAR